MEICPNRIRGGMVTFQAVWQVRPAFISQIRKTVTKLRRSNIGGIIVSVMMQQLNQKHPDDYLIAMRILWAPIGLMILCWVFIPESPWFHARRGNRDAALRSLKQLYGNVEGYDFEEEYGIIARTIEHETQMLNNRPRFRNVFQGLNLVCLCRDSSVLALLNFSLTT